MGLIILHSQRRIHTAGEHHCQQNTKAFPKSQTEKIQGFVFEEPLKTTMNTAIRCIVLLACAVICISKPILKCRCAKTSKTVNSSLIHLVEEYEPRPYCNKKEVIVVLNDRSSWCLDPEGIFTKALLRTIRNQKMLRAKKMKATSTKQIAASTIAAPTSPK